MTVNALKHRVDEPAAKPSSPSVKLTALLIAIMMNAAQKTQPIGPKSKDIESQRVKDTSVCTSVNRTIRIANPNATVESPIIFILLFNPAFCEISSIFNPYDPLAANKAMASRSIFSFA